MPRREPHLSVIRPRVCALRTAQDPELLARTGLDEVTVRRVRAEFNGAFARMPPKVRDRLSNPRGAHHRLEWVNAHLRLLWHDGQWDTWLAYLECAEPVMREMEAGSYPIGTWRMSAYSILLGIGIRWLCVGEGPEPAPDENRL